MSIRHGVYIQEEATAVQVPKTGNSSVQVVVGTAPVNMAENPRLEKRSEASERKLKA